jgi:hypothetical protein
MTIKIDCKFKKILSLKIIWKCRWFHQILLLENKYNFVEQKYMNKTKSKCKTHGKSVRSEIRNRRRVRLACGDDAVGVSTACRALWNWEAASFTWHSGLVGRDLAARVAEITRLTWPQVDRAYKNKVCACLAPFGGGALLFFGGPPMRGWGGSVSVRDCCPQGN